VGLLRENVRNGMFHATSRLFLNLDPIRRMDAFSVVQTWFCKEQAGAGNEAGFLSKRKECVDYVKHYNSGG
jgi:hypothetical protein